MKKLVLRQEIAKIHEYLPMSVIHLSISTLQELALLAGSYEIHLTLNTPNLKEFSFKSLDLGVCHLDTTELFTVAQSIEKVYINAGLWVQYIKDKGPSEFSDKYKLTFLDLSKKKIIQ